MIRRATPDDLPALVELVYGLAEYDRAPDQCALVFGQTVDEFDQGREIVGGGAANHRVTPAGSGTTSAATILCASTVRSWWS